MAYKAEYRLIKSNNEKLSELPAKMGLRQVSQIRRFNESNFRLFTNPPTDPNITLFDYLVKKGYIPVGSYTETVDPDDPEKTIRTYSGDAYFILNAYGGSASPVTTNTTPGPDRVIIVYLDKEQGADRSMIASWTYANGDSEELKKVDHFSVKWEYKIALVNSGKWQWCSGDKKDITSDEFSESPYSKYTAPSNALEVRISIKPVSVKTDATITGNKIADAAGNWFIDHTTAGQFVADKGGITKGTYFTGIYTSATYIFSNDPPPAPTGLDVKLEDYKLTASLSGIDSSISHAQFRYVMDNDSSKHYDSLFIVVNAEYASCTWDVEPGHKYKVQCRLVNGKNGVRGEWSAPSDNYSSGPSATTGTLTAKAISESSVRLSWGPATNAKTYEVEYTTNKDYFDASTEVQSISVDASDNPHAIPTGLTSGEEWFFRVRAVSDGTNSKWTEPPVSVKVGTVPIAPTTWSSTVTAEVGDEVTLYWVHNSEDGSTETTANLSITIGGKTTTKTITNTNGDATSSYKVSTSGYTEGTTITWKVQTKGILATYGPWSAERTITVYAKPTVSLVLRNSSDTQISTMISYPLKITGSAGPNTQTPIGYDLSIVSADAYLTTDDMGNYKMINAGDEVFSKYYNSNSSSFSESLSANDVNLDNGHSYTVILTVAMNSGLTGTSKVDFDTSWTDTLYTPNAEISLDYLNMSAYIRPYCKDGDNNLLTGYRLSVYRREYDGSFTEIAKGLKNTDLSVITDPHPSLDYARYRITAMNESTGTVSYYDVPGIYFGVTSVIMQWDEQWRTFDSSLDYVPVEPVRTGSMLYLNYNIDVSDDYETDSSLVKYIGRDYPVSYYGTQKGMTSTWDVEIPKTDKDTLYAIRRLAIWMGDVYVREPSGTGYWARVSVSYNTRHRELTIPVSFRITRVEGGK